MNWGYKILFVYLAFVAGIVLMVFKSSTQKVDLVTSDYYAKELKYQDRIDAINRSSALSSAVTYEVINQQLIISFPKEFAEKKIIGTILLYCPSNDNKDLKKELQTTNGTISMEIPASNKGAYELQLNWQVEDKTYYFQDKLFL